MADLQETISRAQSMLEAATDPGKRSRIQAILAKLQAEAAPEAEESGLAPGAPPGDEPTGLEDPAPPLEDEPQPTGTEELPSGAPTPEKGEGVAWDDPAYQRQIVSDIVDSATFGFGGDLLQMVTAAVPSVSKALFDSEDPFSKETIAADQAKVDLPTSLKIGAAVPGALLAGPAALAKGGAMLGAKAARYVPGLLKKAGSLAGGTLGTAAKGVGGTMAGAASDEALRAAARGESLPGILQSAGEAAVDPLTLAGGAAVSLPGVVRGAGAAHPAVKHQRATPMPDDIELPEGVADTLAGGPAAMGRQVADRVEDVASELTPMGVDTPDIAAARELMGMGKVSSAIGEPLPARAKAKMTKQVLRESAPTAAGGAAQTPELENVKKNIHSIDQAYDVAPELRKHQTALDANIAGKKAATDAEEALQFTAGSIASPITTPRSMFAQNLSAIADVAEKGGRKLEGITPGPFQAGALLNTARDAAMSAERAKKLAAEDEERKRLASKQFASDFDMHAEAAKYRGLEDAIRAQIRRQAGGR